MLATYGNDCDDNVLELLQVITEDHPFPSGAGPFLHELGACSCDKKDRAAFKTDGVVRGGEVCISPVSQLEPATVGGILAEAVRRHGERELLVYDGRRAT